MNLRIGIIIILLICHCVTLKGLFRRNTFRLMPEIEGHSQTKVKDSSLRFCITKYQCSSLSALISNEMLQHSIENLMFGYLGYKKFDESLQKYQH